jgi:glycerol kinase
MPPEAGKGIFMQSYILVIDEGTTGVRAIIFDLNGTIISKAYEQIQNYHPQIGWSEQDPEEIWNKTVAVIKKAVAESGLDPMLIKACGITNQRATNLFWNKRTGKPLCNAITWQDVRATDLCEKLNHSLAIAGLRLLGGSVAKIAQYSQTLRKRKNIKLLISASNFGFTPSFPSAQAKWVFENISQVRDSYAAGDLLFGTIDTWLVWNLTGGKIHATDFSNAGATALFDPYNLEWSKTVLALTKLPATILPEVKETADNYGVMKEDILGVKIPIAAVVADQQGALFGSMCFEPGDVKCTQGTGAFVDMNTGCNAVASTSGLLPFVAWKLRGQVVYMLEGYTNMAGAAVQWLKDNLRILDEVEQSSAIAAALQNTEDLYLVPAFSGLSTPHWDSKARGVAIGLNHKTTREHIIRATLESIVYQCKDILDVMEAETKVKIQRIKVNGGVAKNDFIQQFLADITRCQVERPANFEVSALGAAYLAGLQVGLYRSIDEIKKNYGKERTFTPEITPALAKQKYHNWQRAIERSFHWSL